MKNPSLILCVLALIVVSGCSGREKTQGQVPDFRIVELQDTGTAEQRSYTIKVALPSHYSEESVKSTLPIISKILNEPESKITMLFYGPHSDPEGPYDIARVVWNDDEIEEIDYKQPAFQTK